MKRSIKITLAVVVWGFLYSLLLWRLPYIYQVDKIKLPDGCRYIKTTISWTDTFWSHVITWKLIEADHNPETDVWKEIQKLNPELEGRFGGFDVSDEPIMFLDISDPKSVFAEYEEQALGRLINRANDDSKHYYVLKYFKEARWRNVIIVFVAGILSTVLAGVVAGYLTRRPMRKKK